MRKNEQFRVAKDPREEAGEEKGGMEKQLAAKAVGWMGGERRTQRRRSQKNKSECPGEVMRT